IRALARARAFTLIELLVVIAIIAIMMAAAVPVATTVNDRARTGECDAHLQQIGVALRLYAEDHGRYPAALQEVSEGRYIDPQGILRCSRGEHAYYYRPPGPNAGREDVIVACVDPATPAGKRPHGNGLVAVVLQLNGKTRLDRAAEPR